MDEASVMMHQLRGKKKENGFSEGIRVRLRWVCFVRPWEGGGERPQCRRKEDGAKIASALLDMGKYIDIVIMK